MTRPHLAELRAVEHGEIVAFADKHEIKMVRVRGTLTVGALVLVLTMTACGGKSRDLTSITTATPQGLAITTATPHGLTTTTATVLAGIASVGTFVTVVPADAELNAAALASLTLSPDDVGTGADVVQAAYSSDGTSFRVTMKTPDEEIVAQTVWLERTQLVASLRSFLAQMDQAYGEVLPTTTRVGDESYLAVARPPAGPATTPSLIAVSQNGQYLAVLSLKGAHATADRIVELLNLMVGHINAFRRDGTLRPLPTYAPSPPSNPSGVPSP